MSGSQSQPSGAQSGKALPASGAFPAGGAQPSVGGQPGGAPSGTGPDPSMEDILASIRRILSEEDVPADPPAAKAAESTGQATEKAPDVLILDNSMLVDDAARQPPTAARGSLGRTAPPPPPPVLVPPAAVRAGSAAAFDGTTRETDGSLVTAAAEKPEPVKTADLPTVDINPPPDGLKDSPAEPATAKAEPVERTAAPSPEETSTPSREEAPETLPAAPMPPIGTAARTPEASTTGRPAPVSPPSGQYTPSPVLLPVPLSGRNPSPLIRRPISARAVQPPSAEPSAAPSTNPPATPAEADVPSDTLQTTPSQPESSPMSASLPSTATASPGGLTSPETANAAAGSVTNLVRALTSDRGAQVSSGGPTIADLVREEMRPMLKAWLDSNLPPLVERLVRAEIERVISRAAV